MVHAVQNLQCLAHLCRANHAWKRRSGAQQSGWVHPHLQAADQQLMHWSMHILECTGRALVGLGVGLAAVAVPAYLAECAPSSIRATLVTANVFMITFGQFAAYFLDYLFTFVPGTWRWDLPLSCHYMSSRTP